MNQKILDDFYGYSVVINYDGKDVLVKHENCRYRGCLKLCQDYQGRWGCDTRMAPTSCPRGTNDIDFLKVKEVFI